MTFLVSGKLNFEASQERLDTQIQGLYCFLLLNNLKIWFCLWMYKYDEGLKTTLQPLEAWDIHKQSFTWFCLLGKLSCVILVVDIIKEQLHLWQRLAVLLLRNLRSPLYVLIKLNPLRPQRWENMITTEHEEQKLVGLYYRQ